MCSKMVMDILFFNQKNWKNPNIEKKQRGKPYPTKDLESTPKIGSYSFCHTPVPFFLKSQPYLVMDVHFLNPN